MLVSPAGVSVLGASGSIKEKPFRLVYTRNATATPLSRVCVNTHYGDERSSPTVLVNPSAQEAAARLTKELFRRPSVATAGARSA